MGRRGSLLVLLLPVVAVGLRVSPATTLRGGASALPPHAVTQSTVIRTPPRRKPRHTHVGAEVDELALVELGAQVRARARSKATATAKATAGWTGEHGYCELCIYAVHQVGRST